MSQTSVNVIAGDDARASDFNKVVADLAEIYAGGPGIPVGGVIYWWSDNTVPLNFKVCDGTIIADSASPINGLTVPNLIDRFIRGVANANIRVTPASGGEDEVTLTTNQMPSHSHSHNNPSHSHGVNDPGHRHNLVGMNKEGFDLNQRGTEWAPLFENGGNASVQTSGTGISIQSSGISLTISSTGGGAAHNNIPAYRGLVAVMRIK